MERGKQFSCLMLGNFAPHETMLRDLLKANGVTVLSLQSTTARLAWILEHQPPDFVLCAARMKDGQTFLQAVRTIGSAAACLLYPCTEADAALFDQHAHEAWFRTAALPVFDLEQDGNNLRKALWECLTQPLAAPPPGEIPKHLH